MSKGELDDNTKKTIVQEAEAIHNIWKIHKDLCKM